MTVTVYTKPNCVQCEWTKKLLAQRGIEYTEIDIDQDRHMADHLRETGRIQMPYVVVSHPEHDDDSWSGFKIEKLKGLHK